MAIQARTVPKRSRIDTSQLPLAKPEPRRRSKAREKREAAAVVQEVRPQVEERDGHCRLATRFPRYARELNGIAGPCAGRSEWAHLRGHRRSQTRNQAPRLRHTTAHTAMLCTFHHGLEERGKIHGIYQTERCADGPMTWETPRGVFDEAAAA